MDGFSYQSDNFLMKPIAECMGIDPKLLTPVTMMLPWKFTVNQIPDYCESFWIQKAALRSSIDKVYPRGVFQ